MTGDSLSAGLDSVFTCVLLIPWCVMTFNDSVATPVVAGDSGGVERSGEDDQKHERILKNGNVLTLSQGHRCVYIWFIFIYMITKQ